MRPLAGMLGIAISTFVYPSGAWAFSPPKGLVRFENQIKEAVAKIRPAVVKVSAFGVDTRTNTANGAGLDQPATYRSIGSGIIVDPRGYVLTNAHVIRDFQNASVRLWRSPPIDYVSAVVYKDIEKDLALLKLEGMGPFPYVSLQRTIDARVGDWVIALGSPYGLEHSASMGIVSDRARPLLINGQTYKDLIQTDAAINQGNSGGPLINLQGEILGISTAIYAPHGVFAGLGFAISTGLALAFLDSVLNSNLAVQAAAVARKEPIRAGAKAPHTSSGPCTNCHTFLPPKNAPSTKPSVIQIAFSQAIAPSLSTHQNASTPKPPYAGAFLVFLLFVLAGTLWKINRAYRFF